MSPIGSSAPVSSPTQGVQAAGEDGAAGVDADDRQAVGLRVLLGDLVGDPPQRSPQIVVLEHDLLAHFCCSFLASRDRVKGRRAALAAGRRPLRPLSANCAAVVARVGLPGSRRSRAPFGMSSGSPRSGNGISIEVEVAGGDGGLEDLAGLLEHLADVVAGGDVDQGEHLHVGLARRPRRPGRRSSGRSRRRAGPPPRRSWRRGPAARRRAAASTRRLAGRGVAGDRRSCGPGAARPSPARARPAPSRPATSSPRCRRREGRAFGDAERASRPRGRSGPAAPSSTSA